MLRPLALCLLLATAAVLATGDDAPSGGLALEAGVAGPVRVAPVPPLPPGGDPAPHAFADTRRDGTGRPVLFDPCRPVPLVVRRTGELPGADALLDEAVASVAAATGLQLVRGADVQGPLPAAADQGVRRADGRFPPAQLAWASAAERPELEGGTLALGGGTTWAPEGRSGEERLVSGLVVLDVDDLREVLAGPDGLARLRGVLLHELAHLVGLGHVDDATQLLHPASTATAYGAGDLRGLHAAGQGQCFADW